MKFNALAITLLPAALALPTTSGSHDAKIAHRQSAESITDELLFSITLPMFTTRRNARDPSTLDWSSDGCTSSPDNPFGFPFTPACNRHDFGYNNYRDQGRFTESGKAKIDTNFKDDLYYQCKSVTVKGVCEALAEVYYAAVRAFGGGDASPGKRAENALVKEYEDKLAIYHELVAEAQEKGELPMIDGEESEGSEIPEKGEDSEIAEKGEITEERS